MSKFGIVFFLNRKELLVWCSGNRQLHAMLSVLILQCRTHVQLRNWAKNWGQKVRKNSLRKVRVRWLVGIISKTIHCITPKFSKCFSQASQETMQKKEVSSFFSTPKYSKNNK